MVELYQDTLIDLLLPKNAKHLKLDIKKDSTVIISMLSSQIPFVNILFLECKAFKIGYPEGFEGVDLYACSYDISVRKFTDLIGCL